MSGGRRTNARAAAIAALVAGNTRASAAQQAGVAESTLYRWLSEPTFVQQVRGGQAELLSRVASQLASVSTVAVLRLDALLNAASEAVRLGAVRTAFEYAGRLRETVELTERLADLERRMGDEQSGGRR